MNNIYVVEKMVTSIERGNFLSLVVSWKAADAKAFVSFRKSTLDREISID